MVADNLPDDSLALFGVTSDFAASLAKRRAEKPGADLLLRDCSGEILGVVVPRQHYDFLRTAQHMLQHPEAHGLRIRNLWDTGPKLTVDEAFGDTPISKLKAFRIAFYRRRLDAYRMMGLRPSGTE